jgi:pyruvate/2-oxoglutarate/acetoin dehydrogenase E1 component
MTYKESLTTSMDLLAMDPKTVFVGYNVRRGSMANGTLVNVPKKQLIETPVAENLMMGMAVGLSLEGFLPVVYFERFDFILNAMDAIINHLDKLAVLSTGQFKPKVIIRIVVGANAPLFTGPTHTQDFTEALRKLVSFPVIQLASLHPRDGQPTTIYGNALASPTSTAIVEYRELYPDTLREITY